jgi:hypothetical protein
MTWLLIFAGVFAVLALCVVLEHLLFERRQPPPARSAVRTITPLPQRPSYGAPSWGRADYAPPGPGRHRKPEEHR